MPGGYRLSDSPSMAFFYVNHGHYVYSGFLHAKDWLELKIERLRPEHYQDQNSFDRQSSNDRRALKTTPPLICCHLAENDLSGVPGTLSVSVILRPEP